MRWPSACLTAALLFVLMVLPRPKPSLIPPKIKVAPTMLGPLLERPMLPPMQEPPATLLLPPPPPAVTGAERGGYTFFSTDYHIAPIADITDVFDSLCREGLCMHVEEHSFSGACGKKFGGRKPTCARGLKVVTAANAFDLCPRPHALRRSFFNAYRGPHSALQHVDAFVCNHPPALCELYMPFNKSILVIASVNLEFSRENPTRWKAWLNSLRRIARDPRNVIAANNKYDAEYIRYFAGVDAMYIPSYCGYAAKAQYAPVSGKSVLYTNFAYYGKSVL